MKTQTIPKQKQAALKARGKLRSLEPVIIQFIVKLNTSAVPVGTARMLTKVEIEELRRTKQSIALYMQELINCSKPDSTCQ